MKNDLTSYLITDPKYYSNNLKIFEERLKRILDSKKIDIACFRDKTSENFKELATIFVKVCKQYHIDKILINENYILAKELNATGVHLTSSQFDKIKKAKELNLFIIISCHNYDDIEKAKKLDVNTITYSPIFPTPNKGIPKGIEKLKECISVYKDLDIIALGGVISKNHIEQISVTNAFGFASIRYFTN